MLLLRLWGAVEPRAKVLDQIDPQSLGFSRVKPNPVNYHKAKVV